MSLITHIKKGKSYLYIEKINFKVDFCFKIEKDLPNNVFRIQSIRGSLKEKRFELIGLLNNDSTYTVLIDCVDSDCFKYIIDSYETIENDKRLIILRFFKKKKYE